MHYVKYLIVPEDIEQAVRDRRRPAGGLFFKEVTFVDGASMAFGTVAPEGDYIDAVRMQGILFDSDDCPFGATETRNSICGEYSVRGDESEYSVIVTTPSNIQFHNDVIRMAELLVLAEAAGVFSSAEVQIRLASVDWTQRDLDRFMSRVRHRLEAARHREDSDENTESTDSMMIVSNVLFDMDWSLHDVLVALCSFIDSCGLVDHLDAYLSTMSGPWFDGELIGGSNDLGHPAVPIPEERDD